MYFPPPTEIMECAECSSRKTHEIAAGQTIKTVCNDCGHSAVTGVLPPLPTPQDDLDKFMIQTEPVRRF
jgi:hypothetical protein